MMKKNPSQLGANAVWDGPYKSPESSLLQGNSRSHMKVSQAKVPYTAGPVTSRAQR